MRHVGTLRETNVANTGIRRRIASAKEGCFLEEHQVVVFRIDQEEYAIAKTVVKGTVPYPVTTKLPGSPDYLEDVISVGGQFIPVISLYAKLGLPHDRTKSRWVLILDIGSRQMGLLVDEVTEIVQMAVAIIKSMPDTYEERGSCIKGVCGKCSRLIFLLDPLRLFSKSELTPIFGPEIIESGSSA